MDARGEKTISWPDAQMQACMPRSRDTSPCKGCAQIIPPYTHTDTHTDSYTEATPFPDTHPTSRHGFLTAHRSISPQCLPARERESHRKRESPISTGPWEGKSQVHTRATGLMVSNTVKAWSHKQHLLISGAYLAPYFQALGTLPPLSHTSSAR